MKLVVITPNNCPTLILHAIAMLCKPHLDNDRYQAGLEKEIQPLWPVHTAWD